MYKQIFAYDVLNVNLPIATKTINCSSTNDFKANVIDIIKGDYQSIIIVEIYGSYPYIQDKWDEFIIEQEGVLYEKRMRN